MRALIPLLLAGCLNGDRFDSKWAEERCALLAECEALDLYGHSSQEQCLSETAPLAEGCESFDREVASDCLDGVDQMTCYRLLKGRFPNACDQVCDED